MSLCSGQEALDKLAELWALHDGELRGISIASDDSGATYAELICTARPESPVSRTRIQLRRLLRADISWSADRVFYCVSEYKAVILPSGNVYLSLDPFDGRVSEPDERDNDVLEAEEIIADFEMKPAARK